MKRLLLLLGLLVPMGAYAACPDPTPINTVCIEWTAPTHEVPVPGGPPEGLPLTDLDGFFVYWALDAGDFDATRQIEIPDEGLTEFTSPATSIIIPAPPGGGDVDIFFVMTAYDARGNESAFSNQVGKVITFPDTTPPQPPQILNVIINVDTS